MINNTLLLGYSSCEYMIDQLYIIDQLYNRITIRYDVKSSCSKLQFSPSPALVASRGAHRHIIRYTCTDVRCP